MPKHITVNDASGSFVATPPASGTTETATSGKQGRAVFGTVNLTAGAVNAADIILQIETGVGTGVYVTVQQAHVNGGLTTPVKVAFCFWCPPGFRYKWVAGGLAGVTESIAYWNYVDFG